MFGVFIIFACSKRLMCKEASKKLNTYLRIARHLNVDQKTLLMNLLFYSQFDSCTLVWMFASRTSNHSTDKLHKRALQVMHNDYTLTDDDILEIDSSVTIHIYIFNLYTLLQNKRGRWFRAPPPPDFYIFI